MKRRLLLLNVLLLALCVLCAWRLRTGWLEARARERAVLGVAVQPAKPALDPVQKAPEPVTSAGYMAVAERLLFHRDRNPNVVIDVTPPKVMPALPVIYGVLLITDPPLVIMSEKAGAPNKGYRPGDRIGEFKLVSLNDRLIQFEWDGKQVERAIDDLRARSSAPPAEASPAAAPAPPSAQEAKASTVIASPATSSSGPGIDVGADVRACSPGDSAAPGAVQGGYRKVVTDTPFGKSCRWEKVK